MRRSPLHRLTTKLAALLAVAAVGIVQPMLSACTCGFLAPQPEEQEAAKIAKLRACCSSCCSTEADEAAVASCCSSGNGCNSAAGDGHPCDDGSCCVSAEEYPFNPQVSSSPIDDASTAVAYLAAPTSAFHCGLNGAAWHNAFDRTSPGGPPGIRLHALLSVWRN
jgi:hypothetical protein